MGAPLVESVRVWDLPTRLFHWLLALAVIGAVVTARMGGDAMAWHFRIGYCIFALLAFRLLWGVVGGRWSRFASFIHSPGAILRHLRGRRRDGEDLDVGHTPSGSLSVFALLAVLMLQVASGLVADDEIDNVGPLNKFVSSGLAGKASSWHVELGQWLIIALVALHVQRRQTAAAGNAGKQRRAAATPPGGGAAGWLRRHRCVGRQAGRLTTQWWRFTRAASAGAEALVA
jgi:cytochrome b